MKFHAFFQKVLVKGEVLGKVDHFYWKKEYQNRGAPHYHVLLWIRDAPIIDQDEPGKVLAWIQERITCQIPSAVATRLLPGAGLDFLAKCVKTQN